MKLERVIDVFRIEDEAYIGSYILNLDAKGILNVVDDLVLNKDDFQDEVYDPYFLTEAQVKKLIPYLEFSLNMDFKNNLYQLMCYETND